MTATLVNLTDNNPAHVKDWQAIGDFLPSMSTLVRQIRTPGLTTADGMAEWRLWGSSVLTVRAVEHPIDPKDRWTLYTRTVGYTGEKNPQKTYWDRVIWTNEPPHHNVGRVFVGREELEDV